MRSKLVYGVGINDADYITNPKIKENGKWVHLPQCPYYQKWSDMLKRCYSKKSLEKRPTYKGCSVCDEWKYFSKFRAWMEQQKWQGRQLDKDFLVEGGKVYSPSTCVFVPQKVNTFITTRGNKRGDYPLGVSLVKGSRKNPYRAECNDGNGVLYYLGLFPTPEQAHRAWLHKKLEVCNEYLEEFKDEPLVVKGITKIKDKLQYHIETNTELTSF